MCAYRELILRQAQDDGWFRGDFHRNYHTGGYCGVRKMKTFAKIILFLVGILTPFLISLLIAAIWADQILRTLTAKGYSDDNDPNIAARDVAQVVIPVEWIGLGASVTLGAFLLVNFLIKRKRNQIRALP